MNSEDIEIEQIYDLETTCRTCTASDPDSILIPIFSKNADDIKPFDLIKPFFNRNFKVNKDDKFPKNICESCFNNFSIINEFLTQCEKSENNFRIFFNTTTSRVKTNNRIRAITRSQSKKDNFSKLEMLDLEDKNDATDSEIELKFNEDEHFKIEYIDAEDIPKDMINISHENIYDEQVDDGKEFLSEDNNSMLSEDNDVEVELSEITEEQSVEKNMSNKKQCSICNKHLSKNFEKHLNSHRPIIFSQCKVCGKVVDDLTQHNRRKHDSSKYKCKYCGEAFDSSRKHTVHIYKNHKKPKYQCDVCEKTFIFPYILTYHKKNVHSTETNAICDICGKTFKSPNILACHRSTHTIERKINKDDNISIELPSETNSFQCPFCSLSFRNLFGLQNHSKQHNKLKNSESYRHVCEYCSQRFNRSDHLQIHLGLVHLNNLPFECSICSKRFVKQYVLNQHIRRKHVETSHKCPYCDKVYAFRVSRTRHIRVHHLKEKRFKCDICGEAFIAAEHCKKHMEKHTIQEEQDTVQRIYEEILEKQSA